jgi:hypothetical protein
MSTINTSEISCAHPRDVTTSPPSTTRILAEYDVLLSHLPRVRRTLGISCKGPGSLASAALVSFIPLFDRAVLYPVVAVEPPRPPLPSLIVSRTSTRIRPV